MPMMLIQQNINTIQKKIKALSDDSKEVGL
jgi:hypothetical protein